MVSLRLPLVALSLALPASVAGSAQWSVAVGGDALRSGLSAEVGPTGAEVLWDGSLPAIVAQQAVSEGDLVVVNRIESFTIPTGTWIVAHELETGAIRWQKQLPMNFADSWRSRVTGVKNGRVFATRSGNTNAEYLYALNPVDGSILWESDDLITETSTESLTFAPNGDPVTSGKNSGGSTVLLRINAATGATVWSTTRSCPTSGGCNPAIFGDRVYVFEASFNGPKITAFDLDSGARLYSSVDLGGGFIQQVGPFCGHDGTVYAPRTANTPGFDFLFALEDTGSGFTERWRVPIGYVPFASHAIAEDGSIYAYDGDLHVMRLGPANGAILARTDDPITVDSSAQPRMAVDTSGKLYVTNGRFSDGRLLVYTPDLHVIWESDIQNVNLGGPVLADDGTLVVCGTGFDVRAYRSDCDAYGVSYGDGCVASGGFVPTLELVGCPAPGNEFVLAMRDLPGGAPGFLAVGAAPGTSTLPGGCELQIAPLLPAGVTPFVLPGSGPGGGDLDIELDVPSPAPPLDVFFQVFALDGGAPGGIAATNPVHGHAE